MFLKRGSCAFDLKALHAQEIGSRVLVIADSEDLPLQRIGGQEPVMGPVGMPSIIVTSAAGEYISSLLTGGSVVIQIQPASSTLGTVFFLGIWCNYGLVSDSWIELAYTNWPENKMELLIQVEGLIEKYKSILNVSHSNESEILMWLERKRAAIFPVRHNDESTVEDEL